MNNQLEHQLDKVYSSSALHRLVLGTAQLGLNYGISNTTGMSNSKESAQIIKTAINCGIQYIDTASAYGESESVIGEALTSSSENRCDIITKLSPMSECTTSETEAKIRTLVNSSITKSLTNLRVKKLDVVLLHRFVHLHQWNSAAWKALQTLRLQGIIEELGVSIQTPDELKACLEHEEISFIQLPFNILDHRWDDLTHKIHFAKNRRKLIIHVRSTLLQGLLINKQPSVWKRANVNKGEDIICWLENSCHSLKKASIPELCISYVNSHSWVDGIVIGVDNLQQLAQNIPLFSSTCFDDSTLNSIKQQRPILSQQTLDPSQWKKA